MIQVKMLVNQDGFITGDSYWFVDQEGISLINRGKAVFVYGGTSIQLTMSADKEQYKSGNTYWFIESDAVALLNKGLAVITVQSNKASLVALNAVSSAGNCPAPGNTSDLAGSVAHTTGNGSSAKQKETVTLTGTIGSATITLLSQSWIITFDTSLTVTAEKFAEANATTLLASSINLKASTNTLVFESTTNNVPFTAPTIANNFVTIVADAVGGSPANKYYRLVGIKGITRSAISDEIVVSQGASTTKLSIVFSGSELFDYVVLYQGTTTNTYINAIKVQSGFQISSTIPTIASPLLAYSDMSALDILQVTTYSTYAVVGKAGDIKVYDSNLYFLAVDNGITNANWIQLAKFSDIPS